MLRGESEAPHVGASVLESILAHAEGIVVDVTRLEAAEMPGLTAEDIEHLRLTGDNLARAGLLLTELTADLTDDADDESVEFGSEASYGVVFRYLCITRRFQLVSGQELLTHLRTAGVEIGDASAVDVMEEIDGWAEEIREDARNTHGVSGHVALVGDTHITFGDDGTNLPEVVAVRPAVRQRRLPVAELAAREEDLVEPEVDPAAREVTDRTKQLLEPGPMKASKLVAILVSDPGEKSRDFVRTVLATLLEQGKVFRFRNEAVYYTLDPCVENYKSSWETRRVEERQRKKEKELDIELAADVLGALTRPYTSWQTKHRPDEIYRHIHPEVGRIPEEGIEAVKEVVRALQRKGIVNARVANKGTRSGGSGLGQKAMRSNSHQVFMVWLKSQRVKEDVKRALNSKTIADFIENFTPENT